MDLMLGYIFDYEMLARNIGHKVSCDSLLTGGLAHDFLSTTWYGMIHYSRIRRAPITKYVWLACA